LEEYKIKPQEIFKNQLTAARSMTTGCKGHWNFLGSYGSYGVEKIQNERGSEIYAVIFL